MHEAQPLAARVFYISLVFSNVLRVLSQCNTRFRLLYLLNMLNTWSIKIIFFIWAKGKALYKGFKGRGTMPER